MYMKAVVLAAVVLGSIAAGITLARILLRRAALLRNSDNTFTVRIPFLGETTFNSLPKYKGIVIDEMMELTENLERLKQYLDIDLLLKYAREFSINYIGLEGDLENGSWSPGRLACCTVSNSCKGGYDINLNPNLDLLETALSLSRDLQTTITPSEVYPFLFLHEVGHTTKSGNQDFYAALVNHALSGGSRSLKRRKELNKLKSNIEKFADRFALQELRHWHQLSGKAHDGK